MDKIPNNPESCNAPSAVSYFQIFRYATRIELAATIVGVILGVFSGSGVSHYLLQAGEMFTSFVERTSNQNGLTSKLPLTIFYGAGRILVNATHEENMGALVQDAVAMAKGIYVSVALCILWCILSVLLISWSASRQINRIRILFLRAVLHQDMAWFDLDTQFNFASKMSEDLMKLKEGMGERLSIVSNLVGTAIFCVITVLPEGWELSLACIAVVPFSIAGSIVLAKYQAETSIKEIESYSQAGKQAEEVLKSLRTVAAFGGESSEVKRYKSLLAPAERCGRKRGLITGLGSGFSWVLAYSLNIIGISYGSRLVMADAPEERKYSVGVMLSIFNSVYIAIQSITLCGPHVEMFAAARGAATSIFLLLERKPRIDSLHQGGVSLGEVRGEITFNNVHFSYPARPNIEVLKELSLHIQPGEYVALVGPSGCGKSTILQLMQRIYDPQSGSINLDGNYLDDLNLKWLRSSLGVVGQEPVLFHGTIFENIRIGCPKAKQADVEKVAEMAFAHNFIKKLPNGYDTIIGERGASLSGGQKQRIAIARALLHEPAVLLLDEATSALDPKSEQEVQSALDRARVGRTTLTVSHKLSSIVNADRIICINQGVIVEQGTHFELMKAEGFYHNLVRMGKENKEPVETITKNDEKADTQTIKQPLTKRHSVKKIHKPNTSIIKDDWINAHGSISSAMSDKLKSFMKKTKDNYDVEHEKKQEDEEEQKLSYWQILKLNAPEWPYIVVGSIAAISQGACFPIFAYLDGSVLGIFTLSDANEIISLADMYAGLFFVVAAIAGVSMFFQCFTFTSAGLKMTSRLRQQYFSALLNQEIGYFEKETNTVGAVCARLSGDVAEVQSATGTNIGFVLQGLSSIVIGVIMAFCYNLKLTLVGVAFLPLLVGSIWLETAISEKFQTNSLKALESATSIASEAFQSIKTVQSLAIEEIFLRKFEEALSESSVADVKMSRWRGLVLGFGVYVPFISYLSTILYGAVLVARGEIEYQNILLVLEAIMYGAYMFGHSLVNTNSVNSAKICGQRILSLIGRQPRVRTEDAVDDENWVASGSFNVEETDFTYPTRPNTQVLRGVTLKVDAGRTVALVGPSGCGKSTILQLMQRFYDPDTGKITLDKRNIRISLTLPRLRRQLGVVQQEPVLFDRTLAENIAYGDNSRNVTMDEVVAAAKAANIHTFIVSLPQGYETNLGASGAQLSGGQKQRVCIARALIRSPRLLLLDEATSALDANSERAVSEALDTAAKGRTCITIAHRLTTVKLADLICVVDKGQIVEQGSHTELLQAKGIYYKMWRSQEKV